MPVPNFNDKLFFSVDSTHMDAFLMDFGNLMRLISHSLLHLGFPCCRMVIAVDESNFRIKNLSPCFKLPR
jgi:hypothetical protein